MKYHVNPETGKVSACRAKVKCPFGGSSGSENHFDSKQAAEAASETMMSSKHEFASVRKGSGKSTFERKRDAIRAGLSKAGISDKGLPPVKNEAELIEKWFGGDKSKYELIARISNPKSDLTDKTRDSVSGFVKKGANVGFVPSMAHLSQKGAGSETEISEVDLIDDLPEGKISLQDLTSGRLKAF